MLLEKLIQFSNENVINITQHFKHKKKLRMGQTVTAANQHQVSRTCPLPTSTLDSVLHY